MHKLIFILILLISYSVNAQRKEPDLIEVNLLGQEGVAYKYYFTEGNLKFINIIKEFESKFRKINNGYSDYYREYFFPGGRKANLLSITLIPKNIVSEEQKKAKFYRIYGDKRTLEVLYNIKTKKISKPRVYILNPDI